MLSPLHYRAWLIRQLYVPVLYTCFEDNGKWTKKTYTMLNRRHVPDCRRNLLLLGSVEYFLRNWHWKSPILPWITFVHFQPCALWVRQAITKKQTNKKSCHTLSGKSTNFWEVGNNTNIYHPHEITTNKQQLPQSIKSKCSKSFQFLVSVFLVKFGDVALNSWVTTFMKKAWKHSVQVHWSFECKLYSQKYVDI